MQSTNKFHKPQIRKFADLPNLSDLRIFRKCGCLQICNLRTQSFCQMRICDLQIFFQVFQLLQIRKNIFFSLQIKAENARLKFVQKTFTKPKSGRILAGFALKCLKRARTLKKRCRCPMVENLRICK